MAIFDSIMENYIVDTVIREGLLSSANIKSQLTTVLLKIFNGKTDMANGNEIGKALKQVRGITNVMYLFSINGDKYGATYYQHRYIIEDNKNIMYQVDIWNRPFEIISKTTVKKMYDESETVIPEKICNDFLQEYIKLAKKEFVGYASISKRTIGIYMYTPQKGKQDSQRMGINYSEHKPDIRSIMTKLANKYPDDHELKSNNELSYIG